MWYFIVSLIFAVGLGWYIYKVSDWDRWGGVFIGEIIAIPTLVILGYPVLGLTTGLLEGYSEGSREGYVTKISQKGIIFKTWEGQIQVGSGQQAALQTPFSFSMSEEMSQELQDHLGSRVRIEYTQYLIQPFRYGETSYQVTGIKKLN